MWDKQHGGWFKSVYRHGGVRQGDKNSFDQAYVLLGLTECYRATQDHSPLDYALQTYQLLEQRVWDGNCLGYYESCDRDWQVRSDAKTICIQLDMLTAVLALYEATRDAAFLERARQIADLIILHMLDGKHDCVLEEFTANWVYDPVPSRDQLWVGHNLKAVWLLARVSQIVSAPEYYAAAERILRFALRNG
jgi:mannose/cellobiose epimerase-like protein (N-acyl-D-glucosamine 2-epimerase family)